MLGVVWLPMYGYEGRYEVSSEGKIKSLVGKEPTILSPPVNKLQGYRSLNISQGKGTPTVKRQVHHLVLETFYGPRPKGMHACHNNGIRTDNRIENLRWDTPANNVRDAYNHGTRVVEYGSRRPNTKLKEEAVMEVKKLLAEGISAAQVARDIGVPATSVYQIKYGKAWSHL